MGSTWKVLMALLLTVALTCNAILLLANLRLTSENHGLSKEIIKLNGELSNLKRQGEELKSQIEKLLEVNETLNQEKTSLLRKVENLTETVGKLTRQVEDLKRNKTVRVVETLKPEKVDVTLSRKDITFNQRIQVNVRISPSKAQVNLTAKLIYPTWKEKELIFKEGGKGFYTSPITVTTMDPKGTYRVIVKVQYFNGSLEKELVFKVHEPLVSDFPYPFTNNTLVVIGYFGDHGVKGWKSATIDGVAGAKVAEKVSKHGEMPNVLFDTDITTCEKGVVYLNDTSHNLIAVGCHWVNTVSFYYVCQQIELVPVYPDNEEHNPLVFPQWLYIKSTGEKVAKWRDVEYGKSDYGLIMVLKQRKRYIMVLWTYTGLATDACSEILKNIDKASIYGWNLNGDAVIVAWRDKNGNSKVDLDEIKTTPYKWEK